tara:strand:- start:240 stop:1346 length:1107 start_codon:yes stop_codon:yes gene_type:complete
MCTSIIFKKSKKGPQLSARSLDFFFEINTNLAVKKAGDEFGNYAIASLAYKKTKFLFDGMNEEGLAISALWFPTTQYPEIDNIPEGKTVVQVTSAVDFILSNYNGVKDLHKDLGPEGNVVITFDEKRASAEIKEFVKQAGGQLPLHFSVVDKSGNKMAIEFFQGKTQLYTNFDNDEHSVEFKGMLTNNPTYPYQIDNLSKYARLDCVNNPGGSNGSGLYGVPGDASPMSRFVTGSKMIGAAMFPTSEEKLASHSEFYKTMTPEERKAIICQNTTMQCLRLLQTCVVPIGSVLEAEEPNVYEQWSVGDYSQWSIVRNHEERRLYFQHFNNPTMYCYDFKGKPEKTDWYKKLTEKMTVSYNELSSVIEFH